MGFVIFDTEKAKPWAAAWADEIKKCIVQHGRVGMDQNSMAQALKHGHFEVAHFNDHNICRRRVKTNGCATPSCWVDHRSRRFPYEERINSAAISAEIPDYSDEKDFATDEKDFAK